MFSLWCGASMLSACSVPFNLKSFHLSAVFSFLLFWSFGIFISEVDSSQDKGNTSTGAFCANFIYDSWPVTRSETIILRTMQNNAASLAAKMEQKRLGRRYPVFFFAKDNYSSSNSKQNTITHRSSNSEPSLQFALPFSWSLLLTRIWSLVRFPNPPQSSQSRS